MIRLECLSFPQAFQLPVTHTLMAYRHASCHSHVCSQIPKAAEGMYNCVQPIYILRPMYRLVAWEVSTRCRKKPGHISTSSRTATDVNYK